MAVGALRTYLTILSIGVVLPGLLFGLGLSWWLASDVADRTEAQAQRLVADMTGDVAEHLRLVTSALQALARSPAIERGDYPEAYRFAMLLSADLGQHIGLALPDGRQVFNTRRSFDAPLPPRAHSASYTRALASGRPSVSNVIVGAIAGKPLITIDVPVKGKSGPLVLATSTDLTAIGAILDRTKLAEGWVAAIIDGQGMLIACTMDPGAAGIRSAPAGVISAITLGGDSGMFRENIDDTLPLVSFYRKVPGTDWTMVVGTPEPVLLAPLQGTLSILAGAGIVTIGLTMLVAMVLGRRLHAAAGRLTDMADALGRGEVPAAPQFSIDEFERVGQSLGKAATVIAAERRNLVAARDQAEQSAASKVRFFASASHDLRQPLQASRLFLDSLRHTALDGRQGQILDHLEMAQNSMAGLVDALLDVAKIDAGQLAPDLAPVNLGQVLHAVCTECRPLAEMKGLRLRGHLTPDAVVRSDPVILARILRNLIHNAIRYTEHGGVLVSCRRRAGAWVVEVWDTGIGIDRQQLDLIWEEFFQVRNSGRDRACGLGLGLAIVQRLCRLLDYPIEVRSQPGRGSRFTIVIPAG